ncbi:hypothetical protein N9L68_01630 [bacterium]|nr:hypothetical protein [bacterium]
MKGQMKGEYGGKDGKLLGNAGSGGAHPADLHPRQDVSYVEVIIGHPNAPRMRSGVRGDREREEAEAEAATFRTSRPPAVEGVRVHGPREGGAG